MRYLLFFIFGALGWCLFLCAEEIDAPLRLPDPGEGTEPWRELAARSRADILPAKEPGESRLPRVSISSDGEIYPGCWLKLSGAATVADGSSILETEWVQKSGAKTLIPAAFFKRPELWLFLFKPDAYSFTFRARNEAGWSAPAEVRFAVNPGRAYLGIGEAFQIAGSCERVVLPGTGWKQVSGPPCVFRGAENGMAVRPNDAGLYVFEAARLEGLNERRGVLVPRVKNGTLGDRRPLARLVKNVSGVAGRPVALDGSLSQDPDPGETEKLVARWTTPDAARGAQLEVQPGLQAFFKARRPGAYSVTLVVSDGQLDSAPETVFIDIAANPDKNANGIDGGEGDAESQDLLDRRVSLAIWPPEAFADGTIFIPDDSGLERAVQMFPRRCGVALMVDKSVSRPENFKELQLAVEAANTPLRHLLDGICRQTGTRYRRDGDRAIWLMKAAAAFGEEKVEPVVTSADALHEKADASELMGPLQAFFKPILDTRAGTSLTYEAEHPFSASQPSRVRNDQIVAVLPVSAGMRLKEITGALREPMSLGLPLPEPPSGAEMRLKKELGEKTVTLHGRYRLDRLLRDLSRDSGIAIGFDPQVFPKRTPPVLNLNFSETPLRQVLRDLVEQAGFDGCAIEAPAGAWLYKGARPYPGGELISDAAVVRAYDLSHIFAVLTPEAAAMLSGETIAHWVKSRVYPETWKEPGTLIFYHAMTRKLVVVHAPEAQRRVLEILNDMKERGEWALGPAE